MPDAVPGVIVTGNVAVDTLVRPVDEIVWGSTRWIDDLAEQLGGNGANTAFTLGKLGIPARLVGWVGRDSLGDRVRTTLGSAGVDLRWLSHSRLPTASSVALVASDGKRALLHRPGASLEGFDSPIDFTPEILEGVRHFHVGNPFSMLGLRRHAAETLSRAKAAGLSTSLDTAWDPKGEWGKVLAPCLPFIDILFANDTEAEVFEREGTSLHAPTVIKKLGGEGCEINGEHVPAFRIEAVDTTGAGDCFAGGFLCAWLRGMAIKEAARFANAVGALSVSQLGSVTGIVGYEETLDWMRLR